MAPLSRYSGPNWLLTFTFFLAGIFFGSLTVYLALNVESGGQKIHPASNQYRLINPLLAVDLYNTKEFSQNRALEIKVQSVIDEKRKSGEITDAAVYFRDIEPGYWVGIDDSAKFSPGNLLKIPIMIAYYKLAESDPTILKRELLYEPTNQTSLTATTTSLLAAGEPYSVGELIQHMIVESDNGAALTLFDDIDKSSLDEIFSDLGIDFREEPNTPDFISLKLYSLFFRVLYNATYLDREYSEKALELLALTPNEESGAALLPKDVMVANRGGVRLVSANPPRMEGSDCGIVYLPGHPYLICIIVHAPTLDGAVSTLENIGLVVYQETKYKYQGQ